MKKVIVFLLLATTLGAAAVEEGQVLYLGGTAPGIAPETAGRLDTTSPADLVFRHAGGSTAIPYARIESFEYSQKLARHFGVVPTLAIAMVKHLRRRHYVRLTYRDDAGTAQAAVFEVPKQMPESLLPVLQARAPQACRTPCRRRW